MPNLCSAHQTPEPNCPACAAKIEDVIPGYAKILSAAQAAGEHKCKCGFTYYKTVEHCPLCGRLRR